MTKRRVQAEPQPPKDPLAVLPEQLRAMARPLTKRQLEILQQMKDYFDDYRGELIYEKSAGGWLGDERVASRTVFALLRLCAISPGHFGGEQLERYSINETGVVLLKAAK